VELVFAVASFSDRSKRMEQSLGSLRFSWLCVVLGALTNTAYLLISLFQFYILSAGTDSISLYRVSSGIWLVLFGLLAIECMEAPPETKRMLFFSEVPVRIYPIALFGMFTVLNGFQISLPHAISLAIGYGYFTKSCGARSLADCTMLPTAKANEWEESNIISTTLVQQKGWIGTASAARNDGAFLWTDDSNASNHGSGPAAHSGSAVPADASSLTGGRVLGRANARSRVHRGSPEARAARLKAKQGDGSRRQDFQPQLSGSDDPTEVLRGSTESSV
jgi:hypothetical protein